MFKICTHRYDDIISIENLLLAWEEFLRGKSGRKDVQEFQQYLMRNIISLHQDLINKAYRHGEYEAFSINDPKPRNIHKAKVRDRLLHHAVYRVLYPYFDKKFIYDSYSCRLGKGTHKAVNRFNHFARKVSKNNTKTIWVLKCDVKRFFDSVDQKILLEILRRCILDKDVVNLFQEIIGSFYCKEIGKGLPLGNLTSQLLVNIYMNEFDQFMKQALKVKYYIRYADDFVILLEDQKYLENILSELTFFLKNKLKLELHPKKVSIKTFASGIDFLGWINFLNHKVLRTRTKRRMFRRLVEVDYKKETVQSYLGLLSHGNAYGLSRKILV